MSQQYRCENIDCSFWWGKKVLPTVHVPSNLSLVELSSKADDAVMIDYLAYVTILHLVCTYILCRGSSLIMIHCEFLWLLLLQQELELIFLPWRTAISWPEETEKPRQLQLNAAGLAGFYFHSFFYALCSPTLSASKNITTTTMKMFTSVETLWLILICRLRFN